MKKHHHRRSKALSGKNLLVLGAVGIGALLIFGGSAKASPITGPNASRFLLTAKDNGGGNYDFTVTYFDDRGQVQTFDWSGNGPVTDADIIQILQQNAGVKNPQPTGTSYEF